MHKAAIVVYADTESHADLGRLTNALTTAREFEEHGDEVRVVFDGAGTQWIPELEDDSHTAHPLYASLKDHVSACEFCSGAFGVEDEVAASGVEADGEFEGHPSVRGLVDDGYDVITF
jgi:hypothetical protein